MSTLSSELSNYIQNARVANKSSIVINKIKLTRLATINYRLDRRLPTSIRNIEKVLPVFQGCARPIAELVRNNYTPVANTITNKSRVTVKPTTTGIIIKVRIYSEVISVPNNTPDLEDNLANLRIKVVQLLNGILNTNIVRILKEENKSIFKDSESKLKMPVTLVDYLKLAHNYEDSTKAANLIKQTVENSLIPISSKETMEFSAEYSKKITKSSARAKLVIAAATDSDIEVEELVIKSMYDRIFTMTASPSFLSRVLATVKSVFEGKKVKPINEVTKISMQEDVIVPVVEVKPITKTIELPVYVKDATISPSIIQQIVDIEKGDILPAQLEALAKKLLEPGNSAFSFAPSGAPTSRSYLRRRTGTLLNSLNVDYIAGGLISYSFEREPYGIFATGSSSPLYSIERDVNIYFETALEAAAIQLTRQYYLAKET